MRSLTYWVILAAICLPSAADLAIPDRAGPVKIACADVAGVERNGELLLADGREVVLEGIRLPGADAATAALAGRALASLRAMVLAGAVTFAAAPPRRTAMAGCGLRQLAGSGSR